jgi:hypothetical protein
VRGLSIEVWDDSNQNLVENLNYFAPLEIIGRLAHMEYAAVVKMCRNNGSKRVELVTGIGAFQCG